MTQHSPQLELFHVHMKRYIVMAQSLQAYEENFEDATCSTQSMNMLVHETTKIPAVQIFSTKILVLVLAQYLPTKLES